MSDRLTKIGVFYDGNYFLHVSNFYNYDHPRRARLSIAGLHRFLETQVAERVTGTSLAKIVDSHYFRGRLNANEAQQRGSVLYYDRVFDDILTSSGVTTHYSPIRHSNGKKGERGIDVWFALEAYESALHHELDVVVLIASDGDYVPLVRKLHGLGCRVIVLAWDFEVTTDNGSQLVTRTSQDLIEAASYPLLMHELIDSPDSASERALIDDLFVDAKSDAPKKEKKKAPKEIIYEEPAEGDVGDRLESEIFSLKNGYGFIKYPPNNLFFHHSTVLNCDFADLLVDDHVEYTLEHNDKGQLVAVEVKLLEEE